MIGFILSQAPAEQAEVVYEFSRLHSLEGWWIWAAMLSGLVISLILLVRFYLRDAAELATPIQRTLIGLRVVVFLGLVFLFGDFQRRTERTLMLPSEVAVVVDTSQSMTLAAGAEGVGKTREEMAIELLDQSTLLTSLSEEHRLNVYSLGEESEASLLSASGLGANSADAPESVKAESAPAQTLKSSDGSVSESAVELKANDAENSRSPADVAEVAQGSSPSSIAVIGSLMMIMGLMLGCLTLILGVLGKEVMLGRTLVLVPFLLGLGMVLTGAVYTVETDRTFRSLVFGGESSVAAVAEGEAENAAEEPAQEAANEDADSRGDAPDWKKALAATDPQSRIGDAIRSVLASHDPATLAGVVLVTDGQNNGGSDVNAALSSARRNEVSIYPVGMGSGEAPLNVRVLDLDAPRRVYPGDKFTVTATLQASGPRDMMVDVELLDGLDQVGESGEEDAKPPLDVIERRSIELSVDGSLVPVRFEMEPEAVGRRRVAVRLVPRGEDQNPQDNLSDAKYEVVSKKLRVLAIAGGPTREYRFVRNLYFRDRSIELDVWLQTGQQGMSQDADQLLSGFPAKAQDLFEYDVIAMFDPDWTSLTLSELELLERWVSQQAGGLILVAGPVFHPKWTKLRTDPRLVKIAGFFPVTFSTRGAMIASGRQGGDSAWPLGMTPEAKRAEFLWLGGDAESSEQLWQDFPGVYDFVDTKDAKPGSKVYAYFSDPTTQTGGTLPVYLASQFYGAGRTFFQASGEMWRIRGEGDQYFQSYFTKLARWVSEGRLLRDSTRGVLLVDSSAAMVGDSVTVRAVLSDEQFEPLDLPEVGAKVLTPYGRIEELPLLRLKGEPRSGTYGGQFVVREAGDYEIRLTLGDALNEQLLRQNVRVRLPTMELERPRRNDDLLNRLATLTDGNYFPMDESTSVEAIADSLLEAIQPRPQQSILPGTYDQIFVLRRNSALMWLLATFLTMEWVVRRLHRLA